MIYDLIQAFKREKISYIVAPYEADAQLAYLSINNIVDAVMTVDSDLITYGCSTVSETCFTKLTLDLLRIQL